MATVAAIDWGTSLEFWLNILYVALGLGFVIFFHELGHFVVAKFCGVFVERFSIGFGPILWSFKHRGTEYALSLVPFGGYVKMLGQDDLDPSQLSSDEIARDPRSYSAKSVSQRMAIISAGVIMNVMTGLIFFACAFQGGVRVSPPIVGAVQVGMPAWRAGLEQGDTITRINDRDVSSFSDIMRGVALTSGTIRMEGYHSDQSTFQMSLTPDMTSTRRMIGVAPAQGLQLIQSVEDSVPPVSAGMVAAKATPPFQPGDLIRSVDGIELKDFPQLQQVLARNRSQSTTFEVSRSGENDLVKIVVPAAHFRTLGLVMDIERITAIKAGSPAAEAGLEVGDKILRVNDRALGQSLNPLELPDYFANFKGQSVKVDVKREVDGKTMKEVSVYVVPVEGLGWTEKPIAPDVPLSVPSIGIAYHLIPTVLRIDEKSPAVGQIQVGDRVKKVELVLPEGTPSDGFQDDKGVIAVNVDGEEKNWAFAFWMMQIAATRTVRLTVSREGEDQTIELTPQPDKNRDWFLPNRGIRLELLAQSQKADDFAEAMLMGLAHTRNSMLDIYLTLRNLIGGQLSYKELHGPIGIAKVAYEITKEGLSKLLLFLGFLSINLAVINFLPIPVLDGGHMLFLAWEGITRKRPSERVMVAATYCGMAFVLGLMLLVIYLDIFVHRLGVD